jgi:hypothetical protein
MSPSALRNLRKSELSHAKLTSTPDCMVTKTITPRARRQPRARWALTDGAIATALKRGLLRPAGSRTSLSSYGFQDPQPLRGNPSL